ncbi:Protein mmf2, mitochondrial [Vanrija pseudolonga]|uniref:Protein mmf2, mitochondrial n=1 Tax=Vanrija pseudolonga TaxID=143232 RepID=A0AAF1BRE3_9TREE|nr:Protein mmf2, mitochondrial [Vanrija pseudolonga]
MTLTREIIYSDDFPLKPHNAPAVKVPGLVFLAGQTATGEIKAATATALKNLAAVLELSGSSVDKIVKVNVWLQDMADFAAMNEVYIDVSGAKAKSRVAALTNQFFPKPCPARTCIQAGCLPGGSSIEIEAIAQV